MESRVGRIVKTRHGFYGEDRSDLWHYRYNKGAGTVYLAAQDALENHPGRASWFWFNGTFCPILLGDDLAKLVERWSEWRTEFQRDPKSLLTLLEGLAPRTNQEPKTRYWLSVSGLPWQEATRQQYILAEQSAGFHPKQGRGPVATEAFGAKGIAGRVTRGEISEATGFDEEFVQIANRV